MESNFKTKSKTDAPEQLREMAEKGAARSKEVFEKMSAASGQRPTLCNIAIRRQLRGCRITIKSCLSLLTPTPRPPSTLPKGSLA